MSLDYMTLAWRTELASGPRLVLLALCDNANDSGSCYPSVQALADKCGLSVRSVRSHVADMEKLGLLERNERTGRSTYYQISLKALRAAVYKCLAGREHISEFDRGILRACAPDDADLQQVTPANFAAPPDDTPANFAAPPGKFCRPPRQILPGTPANSAAITVKEPLLNHQVNGGERAQAPAAAHPGVDGDGADQPAAPKPAKSRKTALPDDLQPCATAQAFAAANGLNLAEEMAAFADHHAAAGTTMADWQAGLRNWLRNSVKFRSRDERAALQRGAIATTGETPYQRSMRERMQEAVPAIARKAPGAQPMQAVEFFETVAAAPALRIGGQP